MFTTSAKHIRMICVLLSILSVVFLFSSCGEEKYKFVADGVLQAPDGTIYHRYENAVYFCSFISLGEFLGKVEGYNGTVVHIEYEYGDSSVKHYEKEYEKGVYSADSSGSDDYIIFLEEEDVDKYENGEYQRTTRPIYVKEGCELNFRDWDRVTYVDLEFYPGLPTYYLEEEYSPSDFMKALIADKYDVYSHSEGDASQFFCHIHYRLEGIDLIDVRCRTEHWKIDDWVMTSTDFIHYSVNPEAFRMFDMPEETEEYLQYPFDEEKSLSSISAQ